MLDQLYRKLVIDHAKYKRNFGRLEGEGVRKIHYKNPTCGDVITLYIHIKDELLTNVSFEGEGCSISMASSSMMTELIQNKDIKTVSSIRSEFEQLIRQGEQSDDQIDLGDALSLQGVHKLKARHNCALMAWQALDRVLHDVDSYKGTK
ncbi:Fe-S cluster assembly sulfur transfer protein SufU [Halalkalibacter alkaliphilus]|uniref:SUF system NifU family Fe-S cluster assembly protein n=1 Tax=Halalkalibacter alkaliphilus TaxID=2917993 RepID=A0A9X2A0Q3_9BACI|nr:SUF system NifU family Fe-S cluster assembly protein [Halalkalibacter alkaliphilus]MCL7746560.1 SUF system NifU family Fe-S cluster assembly protein [Halalkalibacter alkaliphilus]